MSLFDLAAAYGLLILSQSRGPAIVELLHGRGARLAAETLPLVEPDSPSLCMDYELAHFNGASDILHTAGMISAVLLLLSALVVKWRRRRVVLLAWIPPVFYLPAWVGHFVFQKDIPAVFSYGTTLRGWIHGEYCSYKALLAGRTLQRPVDWIPASLLTVALVAFILVRTTKGGGGGGGAAAAEGQRRERNNTMERKKKR